MQTLDTHPIRARLHEAITEDNLELVQKLVASWGEAEAVNKKIAALLNPPKAESAQGAPQPANRRVLLEVTGGGLRQNYLSVTRAVQKGLLSHRLPLTLRIPSIGKEVVTSVTRRGNLLEARGVIAQFYGAEKIEEGDKVLLTEVCPNIFELTKGPEPDFSEFFAGPGDGKLNVAVAANTGEKTV